LQVPKNGTRFFPISVQPIQLNFSDDVTYEGPYKAAFIQNISIKNNVIEGGTNEEPSVVRRLR
jgi:hypothetical protein